MRSRMRRAAQASKRSSEASSVSTLSSGGAWSARASASHALRRTVRSLSSSSSTSRWCVCVGWRAGPSARRLGRGPARSALATARSAVRASAAGRRAASGRGPAGDTAAGWRRCGRRRSGCCPSSRRAACGCAAMFCRAQLLPGLRLADDGGQAGADVGHFLGHLALPGDAVNAAAGAAAAGAEIEPAVGADFQIGDVERIAFEEDFAAGGVASRRSASA